MTGRAKVLVGAALLVILSPDVALAYIGPGAGFAVVGSFLAILSAVLSALSMVLIWPIRRLLRWALRRRPPGPRRFRRVVILGLDGLDHGLTEKLMAEGKLPHFAALREEGGFRALRSTLPPISPVAWSTFQTGVNPGKHNIFDFLAPDERTYEPRLSSVKIRSLERSVGIGPLRVRRRRTGVELLRKSQPFWSVLSRYGIFNCILRVPITFPPEKLRGVLLSAMCVPDLRGTQGTFSLYTTRPEDDTRKTGGEVHHITREGRVVRCRLVGPPHPTKDDRGPLEVPFTVEVTGESTAMLRIAGSKKLRLRQGDYSDWIPVKFRAGLTAIHGVCRFLLLRTEPELELYVTPVNLDPERPAMAIGYPSVYPVYLAKRQGSFATLGLAEDTWGLSEEVLDDGQFREQLEEIGRERESMFFDALEKVPEGLCTCVFDGSDRMQHMFWRYLDEDHPARPSEVPPEFRTAIEDLYVHMDGLVGRTVEACRGTDTLLMVVSDHGFNSFRRGVDLNCWLEENGYLVVDDAKRDEEYLAGVDWSRTRAFALGLAGIFINTTGRFEHGIVAPGEETGSLLDEIAERLATLTDPRTGQPVVIRSYPAARVYRGPYRENAPDLIVGYERGYRVSWETAVGRTSREVMHDNEKAWSGDHCVDPSVVPGVLFCNRKIGVDSPRLLDIAPTVLEQFGVPVPSYMDGRPFAIEGEAKTGSAPRRVPEEPAPRTVAT